MIPGEAGNMSPAGDVGQREERLFGRVEVLEPHSMTDSTIAERIEHRPVILVPGGSARLEDHVADLPQLEFVHEAFDTPSSPTFRPCHGAVVPDHDDGHRTPEEIEPRDALSWQCLVPVQLPHAPRGRPSNRLASFFLAVDPHDHRGEDVRGVVPPTTRF
ncbi:hypothetical protein BIU89_03515 [Curtobacterium sp. MCBA15_005]|nr:hypothetical protein [Curtobacterium flaccumfaciens]OII01869.1 hypothetical protein BIU89_03515 [Curtobacterium sp. MCBA15_005]UWD78306.1 hypothetical protein NY058_12935 [Curtobacterium flaccumfaciens]